MPERRDGDIVDFHMGAFDRVRNPDGTLQEGIAVVFGYDTKSVPRRPAEIIYAPHRAYVNYAEVKEHEIYPGDPRLVALGITAIEKVQRDETVMDDDNSELADVASIEHALQQLETITN